MSRGRPVPTGLAVALVALALLPAALAAAGEVFLWVALAVDVAVLALCVGDWLAAPGTQDIEVRREVEPVLSSGVAQTVRLVLESRSARPVRGQVHDAVPPGVEVRGQEQAFALTPEAPAVTLPYSITPLTRGDLRLGDVHLRLLGPLGLCARQVVVPAARDVKVYPDLTALSREALALKIGRAHV